MDCGVEIVLHQLAPKSQANSNLPAKGQTPNQKPRAAASQPLSYTGFGEVKPFQFAVSPPPSGSAVTGAALQADRLPAVSFSVGSSAASEIKRKMPRSDVGPFDFAPLAAASDSILTGSLSDGSTATPAPLSWAGVPTGGFTGAAPSSFMSDPVPSPEPSSREISSPSQAGTPACAEVANITTTPFSPVFGTPASSSLWPSADPSPASTSKLATESAASALLEQKTHSSATVPLLLSQVQELERALSHHGAAFSQALTGEDDSHVSDIGCLLLEERSLNQAYQRALRSAETDKRVPCVISRCEWIAVNTVFEWDGIHYIIQQTPSMRAISLVDPLVAWSETSCERTRLPPSGWGDTTEVDYRCELTANPRLSVSQAAFFSDLLSARWRRWGFAEDQSGEEFQDAAEVTEPFWLPYGSA